MTTTTINGHEKIAGRNIRGAINWILGGYYNCLQDDCPEYLPESREALEEEIYESAMTNFYSRGMELMGRAPREMRFAGEKFIRDLITKMLDEDGDFIEIRDYCTQENPRW